MADQCAGITSSGVGSQTTATGSSSAQCATASSAEVSSPQTTATTDIPSTQCATTSSTAANSPQTTTTTDIPSAQCAATSSTAVNSPRTTTDASSAQSAGASSNVSDRDCAVCLETMIQPTELPCKHVFCFLCVKGIAQKTRCCALCRREIPLNYFDSPHLLSDPDSEKVKGKTCSDDEDRPLWYYKGRSGWWQYDDRTRLELENAYSKKEQFCEVLIAGYLYVIDFGCMTQYRKDDPIRRRSVKRETQPIKVKGVAGVPLPNQSDKTSNSSGCPQPNASASHTGRAMHHSDADNPGPSCSILLLDFRPSHAGPSASSRSQSKKKDSQGGCATVGEVIILTSDSEESDSDDSLEMSDDDLSELDDDDIGGDYYDDDMEDDDDDGVDLEDGESSSEDDPDVVWNLHFYGGPQGVRKRKAPAASASSSTKKNQSSIDYKTALRLMKAEHTHLRESIKLKHTRALMEKKKPKDVQLLKKQNSLTLEKLKRKHLKELMKLKMQYKMRNQKK
nr:PREDICTED: E3 ubiquitin-protein ligase rnf146-like [Bemisia tabaci]